MLSKKNIEEIENNKRIRQAELLEEIKKNKNNPNFEEESIDYLITRTLTIISKNETLEDIFIDYFKDSIQTLSTLYDIRAKLQSSNKSTDRND